NTVVAPTSRRTDRPNAASALFGWVCQRPKSL
ncbi:MAG: hypothetical protein JWO12_582, partial [Frankiales bacterium]|nr:hypothetical protein [Frankiales bacterium]